MSFFSFLGNAVNDVATKLGQESFPQQLKSLFIDPEKAIVRDTVQGAVKSVDSAVRSGAKVGVDLGNKIRTATGNAPIATPSIAQDVQKPTGIMHFLEGDKPVQTLQTTSAGNAAALESGQTDIIPGPYKFSPGVAKPLGFLGAAGALASNFVGNGEGAVTHGIEKDVAEQVAKATTVDAVKTILKDTLEPSVLERLAPALAHTQDTNIVQNLLKDAPKVVPETVAPARTEINAINASRDKLVANGATSAELKDNTRALQDATARFHSEAKAGADITPPVTPNPVQNVVDALRGAPARPGEAAVAGVDTLNKQQANLYSIERSARLARSTANVGDLTGRDAAYAQLKSLGGKLPRVNSDALLEHLQKTVSPEDVNGILDTVRTSPNLSGYEPITAQKAILGLFDSGKVPAPHEWDILQKSLGSDFTDSIKGTVVDNLSNWQKVKNFAVEVLGAPKAVMASLDLSGGGRQGAVLGSLFRPEWAGAQKDSVKAFASSKFYEDKLAEIAGRENASLYERAKLALASSGGHEEAFPNQLAERIPVAGRAIAASDRGYTMGLTVQRADSFDHIINDLKSTGIDPNTLSDKALKDIGRFINTASGRGNLGALEKHAQALGEALFSPRLWKSRLDMLNPVYYAKLDPIARKYALQAAGSFASIAGVVLALAAAAGAKVETDARSSDFLKIKVGDTRYDILGGFQQNLVLAHRLLPGTIAGQKTYIGSGEKKSSTTGHVQSLTSKSFGAADKLSILTDFIKNKENPVISTGQNLIKGTDQVGNKINPVTEVGKLFVPLNIQDTYKTAQNTGSIPKAILKATIPGSVGVGVGTYGKKDINLTDKQKAYIQSLKTGGKSPEQVAANEDFFRTLKTGPDRAATSTSINAALKAGDTTKARKLAADYNKQYADNFKTWSTQYGKYSDGTLLKQYKSGKINLDASNIKARIKALRSPL